MAQLVSILFFSATLITTLALIAGMLRSEWNRVKAVLSGEMLDRAHSRPQVRVRLRSWAQADLRRGSLPLLAVA